MTIYRQAIDCKYSIDRDLLILNTGQGLYKFKIENSELRENVHDIASLITKELNSIEEEQSTSGEGLNQYAILLLATLNICEKYTKLEKKYKQTQTLLETMQTPHRQGAIKPPSRTPSWSSQSHPTNQNPPKRNVPVFDSRANNTEQIFQTQPEPAVSRPHTTALNQKSDETDTPVTEAVEPTISNDVDTEKLRSDVLEQEVIDNKGPGLVENAEKSASDSETTNSMATSDDTGSSPHDPANIAPSDATQPTEETEQEETSDTAVHSDSSQTTNDSNGAWQQAPPNPSHQDIFNTSPREIEAVAEPETTIPELSDFQIVSDTQAQQAEPEETIIVDSYTAADEEPLHYSGGNETQMEFETTSSQAVNDPEQAVAEEDDVASEVYATQEVDDSASSMIDASQAGTEPQYVSDITPSEESYEVESNIPEVTEQLPGTTTDQQHYQQDETGEDSFVEQNTSQPSSQFENYTVQSPYQEDQQTTSSYETAPMESSTEGYGENGYTPNQDTLNNSAYYSDVQTVNNESAVNQGTPDEWNAVKSYPIAEGSPIPDHSEPMETFREIETSPYIESTTASTEYDQVQEIAHSSVQSDSQNMVHPQSGDYQLPLLSFLRNTSRENEVDHDRIRSDAELLEKKLGYFGIKGEVMGIHPGPVITTYEYRPDPGIKISKIVNLADDLALALSAFSIRIVAPIPGKDVMGIEIPNIKKSLVPFIDVVTSESFRLSSSKVPICLGKDIVGNPVVVELESMPHLLIAGATGTGKSVGLNAMITSILYKASPDEVRFLMIDPKRIELSFYNDIPHLLTPVITDMNKANTALQWMVREMDRRYNLLAEYQVRHIEQFNQKLQNAEGDQYDEYGTLLEPMPYIVVIIDELADLMMTASRDIEFSLTRLAQMARAAGIHLILATQRPSVDVLTGIIKANFPTRISFQVSSKTDSRTIIDANGAETLLGNGDMLFVPPGTARLTRVHGTYVSEDELVDITSFIKQQRKPEYVFDVLAEQDPDDFESGSSQDEYDEKYNEALDFVMTTRQASISGVQRALRVGYNRAARIIDLMEKNGIVGPSDGAKPRKVLTNSMTM